MSSESLRQACQMRGGASLRGGVCRVVLKQLRPDAVFFAIVQVPVIRRPELSSPSNPNHPRGACVVVKTTGRLFSNEPVKRIHGL